MPGTPKNACGARGFASSDDRRKVCANRRWAARVIGSPSASGGGPAKSRRVPISNLNENRCDTAILPMSEVNQAIEIPSQEPPFPSFSSKVGVWLVLAEVFCGDGPLRVATEKFKKIYRKRIDF